MLHAVTPRRAVTILSVVAMGACMVTNPVSFQQEAPVNRPFIRDILGSTVPRLGQIVVLQSTDDPTVSFNVPVDSTVTDQPLQYQWLFNEPRDCVALDGGTSCEPTIPELEVAATGATERVISRQFRVDTPGCYKVELWVSTTGFARSGDFHTPVRPGDLDFATWWIIRQPTPPTAAIDVSTCQLDPTQSHTPS